jgi:hypothetical protein
MCGRVPAVFGKIKPMSRLTARTTLIRCVTSPVQTAETDRHRLDTPSSGLHELHGSATITPALTARCRLRNEVQIQIQRSKRSAAERSEDDEIGPMISVLHVEIRPLPLHILSSRFVIVVQC